MAPSPDGGVFALQACGREESSLRVVRFGPYGQPLAVSRPFEGSALLATGIGTAAASLFVVTAHLSLTSVSPFPYELVVFRLSPETLAVESSASLGRGDAARLATAGDGVLASTGPALYGISAAASGGIDRRRLAGFSPAVVTHLAFDATTRLAVLSTLVPGATGGSSGELETLRVRESGENVPLSVSVAASRPLPPGMSVQALETAGGFAFYAAGGYSTVTYKTPLRSLNPASQLPRFTTLGEVGLASSPRTLFVFSAASVSCAKVASGQVNSTKPAAPAEYLTAMLPRPTSTWAETTGGIGELTIPASCS